MALQLSIAHRDLEFRFNAKTSRGSLKHHTAYYLTLTDTNNPEVVGTGEASPLAGLSIDAIPDFERHLNLLCGVFNTLKLQTPEAAKLWFYSLELEKFPAIKFGLETAFLDFENGGEKIFFDSAFSRGEAGVPINGLVWMGDRQFMQEQISSKIATGFTCLKLKIGGLDFNTELEILAAIREIASPEKLVIRVDANGAFNPENAMEKLEKLAVFSIHSLEQPIKPGQLSEMKTLCKNFPIPIALDEELIGIADRTEREKLLENIRPQFIILKPTLLGGLEESRNWIEIAQNLGINWWITSALESNIGLNAIAQFTATFPDLIPQGLGTGQLYFNNIGSPLEVEKGYLFYRKTNGWEI